VTARLPPERPRSLWPAVLAAGLLPNPGGVPPGFP